MNAVKVVLALTEPPTNRGITATASAVLHRLALYAPHFGNTHIGGHIGCYSAQ